MSRRAMFTIGLLMIGALVLYANVAYGAETISIPNQTHRGDPGQVFTEGTVEAVGDCTATLRYTNNEPDRSEHPNTNILVGPVTFTDVERGAFVEAALPFTGTGLTEVATQLGGDGVTSGGFTVEITCTTTTPTTQPTESSTTTSPAVTPTTALPATTTTSPPPVGGVPAGGGSEADSGLSLPHWGDVAGIMLLTAGVVGLVYGAKR